jgi:plastocyanin
VSVRPRQSALPPGHLRARQAAIALGCTLAWYAIASSAVADGKSVSHTVVIQGLKEVPETLVVKRGDTITWINKDPFPHTVTAKGVFDSGSIAPGGSWRYTAKIVGEHSYTCTFHPNMKGTLRVE